MHELCIFIKERAQKLCKRKHKNEKIKNKGVKEVIIGLNKNKDLKIISDKEIEIVSSIYFSKRIK